MRWKKYLLATLASIIPMIIVVLNVSDLINLAKDPSAYPFGSDFFGKISIYHSKTIYLIYNVFLSLLMLAAVIVAYKGLWRVFSVLAIIGFALFVYPMISNE